MAFNNLDSNMQMPTLLPNDLALFLARAEVRLSTQQRIAGAFLSGAGLLILLPVLFKEAAIRIFVSLIGMWEYAAPKGTADTLAHLTQIPHYVASLLVVCFFVSLFIPVGALWFLIKDLIKFYFVGNIPEYQERIDENVKYLEDNNLEITLDELWKKAIAPAKSLDDMKEAFGKAIDSLNAIADKFGEPIFDKDSRLSGFSQVITAKEEASKLYDDLRMELATWKERQKQKEFLPSFIVFATSFPSSVADMAESSTPATTAGVRESDELKKRVLRAQYNSGHVRFLSDNSYSRTDTLSISKLLSWLSPDDDQHLYDSVPSRIGIEREMIDDTRLIDESLPSSDIRSIHKCLSKAGVVDRNLVDEVAFTEMCLVRNALNLRELVLRYAKAVLAVTWTTIISFIIIAALETGCRFPDQWPTDPILWFSFWYLVWGIFIYSIVTKPLDWIHSLARPDGSHGKPRKYHEKAMRSFENLVKMSAIVAGVCATIATLLSAYGIYSTSNTEGAYLFRNMPDYLACPVIPEKKS